MAAAGEEADAASPLDRRLAPLLLFDDHDGKTADRTHQSRDTNATFFFYSIPSKQLVRKRVPEMEDHRYWTTPQGWLVMASRSSPARTFLWDPFTGARIGLPPDRDGVLRGDGPKRCLLSCKPASAADQNCLVLVVDLAETVLWYCRIGGVAGEDDGGGGRWLKHEYEFVAAGGETLHVVLWAMRRLTSVGGKFFTSLIDKVVALDFSPAAGPQFAVIPADMNAARWRPPSGVGSTTELVESQGSLFCVSFSSSDFNMCFVAGVEIFKLDVAAQAWVRVESLGGRVFLVHDGFGASLDPQEVGLKGDCVYYCMSNDKGLYVHDMERGTTALRDPGPCIGDHCSTKKVLIPTC